MATILTKRSNTASSVPVAGDLTNSTGGAELAVNTADKRLFTKDSGGTVVELGTNPSSITLASGTANAVPYLNGSKVLTSGSALTFDGTNLGIGTSSPDQKVHAYNTASNTWFRAQSGGDNSVGLYMTNSQRSWLWGVSGGGAGSMYLYDLTGSKQVLNIDSSGNLGLGVTPSAWDSNWKAMQFGPGGSMAAYAFDNGVVWGINFYNNAGWKFKGTGYASQFGALNAGGFAWYNSTASGTAGNAITFTQAMTLDASGNLLVGQTGRTEQNSNSFSFDVLAKSVYVNHASGTAAGNGYINFGYNAVNIGSISQSGTTAIMLGSSGDLVFGSGGITTERARIDSSGNFSIGTISTGGGLLTIGGGVGPSTDNASSCGKASNRWSVVYAGTGAINTSDAREKTVVRSLTDAEINAAAQLASEVGAYQWLSSVAVKGEAAREHIGMTVQRAIEIMEANGLAPFNYGFICYDEWADQFVKDEKGNDVLELAAGNRYSFRMDELSLFIARGQQAIINAQGTALNQLKARLDAANL